MLVAGPGLEVESTEWLAAVDVAKVVEPKPLEDEPIAVAELELAELELLTMAAAKEFRLALAVPVLLPSRPLFPATAAPKDVAANWLFGS